MHLEDRYVQIARGPAAVRAAPKVRAPPLPNIPARVAMALLVLCVVASTALAVNP
ncbi:MAG TPA: hypothetical protein VGM84_17465 [Steroidobacteraceae bacterium]|jgi:hypothetical protein